MNMDILSFKVKSIFTILLLSTIIVACAYLSLGATLSIILSIIIISILYITRDIWLPYKDGKTKVRLFSLRITYLATILFCNPTFNDFFVKNLLSPTFDIIKHRYPAIPDVEFSHSTPSILLISFILISVFLVNYFMRDKTITGTHPNLINEEFKEKSYTERLQSFCRVLDNDLNDLDISTNWSSEYFVPLEAEVEIKYGHKKKRKIMDLISAMRSDKSSRVFLVLGDPGAGKSVSLRRLCKQMLAEVHKTGRVPIYINLKEWTSQHSWCEEYPPTQEDLYNFVVQNLKDRLDFFGNEFIDTYFNKMFENGRFFFILDSFDEIPSVLDVDESSWLIDRLSSILYNFLAGAHESRGVLSSRIYRKPSSHFKTNSVLEIRPFSDLRIKESLEKSIKIDDRTIRSLFKEKPEFISVARNPFSAALIKNYVNSHEGKLPNKISELYSSYIDSRLSGAIRRIERRGLSVRDVRETAAKIAMKMFQNPTFGLEAPVEELVEQLPMDKIKDVIDILVYVRLGRVGGSDEQLFSFSHRRFNEYFVAIEIIATNQSILKDSIPTDSRWRDALVMYSEIASDEKATELANFCWNEIKLLNNIKINTSQYMRSIHCIRFLKDAFRSRRECLLDFNVELEQLIRHQISSDISIVTKKIAVEAVGLVNVASIDEIICKAMDVKSSWVQNEAFKACRHLKYLTPNLSLKVIKYISNYSLVDLLKNKSEVLFSLSLSSAFNFVLLLVKTRLFIGYLNITGYCVLFLLFPSLLFMSIPAFIFFYFFSVIKNKKTNSTEEPLLQFNLLLISSIAVFKEFTKPSLPSNGIGFHLSGLGISDLLETLELSYLSQFISVTALIMIIPFYNICLAFIQLKMIKISDILGFTLTLLGIIVATILPVYFFGDYIHEFFSKNSIIIMPIILLTLVFIFCNNLYVRLCDKLKINKMSISKEIDRTILLSYLDRLKTNWGKYKLVSLLENERTKLTGKWRDDSFPNKLHDDAASLLAKIEEKSMGFD